MGARATDRIERAGRAAMRTPEKAANKRKMSSLVRALRFGLLATSDIMQENHANNDFPTITHQRQ